MPLIVVPAPDEQLLKAGCLNNILLEGIVDMLDGALGGTVSVGVLAGSATCNSSPVNSGVSVELAPTSGAVVVVSVGESVELPSAADNW